MGLQSALVGLAAAVAANPVVDAVALLQYIDDSRGEDVDDEVVRALHSVVHELAVDPVVAVDIVMSTKLSPPLQLALLNYATRLHSRRLETSLPHLERLDWRVDITVATNAIAPIWQPTVVLRFRLTDGSIRTTELPLQQFHQLRYSTAKILQEMNQLERHPIMRLTRDGQTMA
ncbi:hypothetical protein ACHHYP_03196 [Achlya hypogyna]|uniref:COMM domain-containing protein 5 n=1 Tax=Achlya hypogyna TaxID=1202772 RepID=A0A0A7CN70_ACHHY|nr:secreted protein [Achlya hypogyna]OQR92777.1 hypothetical protein ACHHYP_03196 [Achlya hypogyna]